VSLFVSMASPSRRLGFTQDARNAGDLSAQVRTLCSCWQLPVCPCSDPQAATGPF